MRTMYKENENYKATQSRKLIFTKQLAEYLLERGHELLEVTEHRTIKGFDVFIFKNTLPLHNDISDFTEASKVCSRKGA